MNDKVFWSVLLLCCLSLALSSGFTLTVLSSLEKDAQIINSTPIQNNYKNITNIYIQNITQHNIQPYANFQVYRDIPCNENAKSLTLTGLSMFPKYKTGDILYWQPIEYEDIQLGDDIRYKDGKDHTIHAVINKYSDYLITQGYNNDYSEKVYKENITGVICK